MKRILKKKKIIVILVIIFSVLLAVILLNFFIHVKHVRNFVSQVRTVDNYSNTTDVLVDIYPRGRTTDTWEKKDAVTGRTLHAKIYEGSIENNSGNEMYDWSLRIDIKEKCWLNNGWNGDFEIHQNVNGLECVQRINLLDYGNTDIALDSYVSGQDLIIPLYEGDYIIYYPCENPGMNEEIINSDGKNNGEVVFGFILYSTDGNIDLSKYELFYKLNKSIWSGKEAMIFLIMLPIWAVSMLVFLSSSIIMVQYEKRMFKQSVITSEFLDVFVDYVDKKERKNEGHSKKVAICAKKIAKELGMTKEDADNVYYAALMHDVGICYVPYYILQKNDGLSNEELEQITQHAAKGAEMLSPCKSVPYLVDGALYHHERYDGKGYPTGKAGEDIPLIGRIICLADYYVSKMIDDDNKINKSDIMAEINNEKGIVFDPMLVEVLIDVIEKEGSDFLEN